MCVRVETVRTKINSEDDDMCTKDQTYVNKNKFFVKYLHSFILYGLDGICQCAFIFY